MESRRHASGRRSNEEHQRYLMIQKKRFEAVVTDSLAVALAAGTNDGEERDGHGTVGPADSTAATKNTTVAPSASPSLP